MKLVQFLHEVVLGVQAARGVDEEIIGFACLSGGDGIVRDGCGVCAVSTGNDFDLEARPPEFELFDGGSAKRVARGEKGGLLLRLDEMRELGGSRGLARAVDAD